MEHALAARGGRRSGGLAAVDELLDDVAPSVGGLARAGLALGGDRVALGVVVFVGLLVGGDPQVDEAALDPGWARPPLFMRRLCSLLAPDAPGGRLDEADLDGVGRHGGLGDLEAPGQGSEVSGCRRPRRPCIHSLGMSGLAAKWSADLFGALAG